MKKFIATILTMLVVLSLCGCEMTDAEKARQKIKEVVV